MPKHAPLSRPAFLALAVLCLLAACAAPGQPLTTATPTAGHPLVRPSPSPAPAGLAASIASVAAIPTPGPLPDTWRAYPSLNQVNSLAFAPDGALWAGTESGAVRWDLATETPERYAASDGLPSDFVRDLAFTPDGTLWAGTLAGIARFDGGRWTGFTEAGGRAIGPVYSITTAPDGSVWFGGQNGAGRYRDGNWTLYTTENGLPDNVVWSVGAAPDGDMWFSTHGGGVARFEPGSDRWTTYSQGSGFPLPNARVLVIDPQGHPWVHIGYDDVYRFDGKQWQAAYKAGGGQWVCDIAFDAGRQPWIATCGGFHAYGAGLAHFDATSWSMVTMKDGLAADEITAVALRADGTIAAGTRRGISVLADGRWRTLRSGPTLGRVTTAAVTGDGVAWFGFGDWASQAAGGGVARFDGRAWQYDDRANSFPAAENVRLLAVAPDGTLWAAGGCGVAYYGGGRWQLPRTVGGMEIGGDCNRIFGNVHSLAFGREGAVWMATEFNVYRLAGGELTVFEQLMPVALAVAPDDTIWIAVSSLAGGGLKVFDGTSGWSTPKAPPPFATVTSLAATPDGHIWANSPEDGLASFDGESWTRQVTEGLPANRRLLNGPDGVLWMLSDEGLARLDGQAWTRVGPKMAGITAAGFAPDGSIWLGTAQGAAHFRP